MSCTLITQRDPSLVHPAGNGRGFVMGQCLLSVGTMEWSMNNDTKYL
jgi:hypothetical protein